MAAAFLEPERGRIGIGDELAFVALARAMTEGLEEAPQTPTARMQELLQQLKSVTLCPAVRAPSE
jgi:hypothetical protein